MSDKDFEAWWASHGWDDSADKKLAHISWAAARSHLLRAEGRPLPEVIAVQILSGEPVLGVLTDWMVEQGKIGEPDVRARLGEMKNILHEAREFIGSWQTLTGRWKILFEKMSSCLGLSTSRGEIITVRFPYPILDDTGRVVGQMTSTGPDYFD